MHDRLVAGVPWWIERVEALLEPRDLGGSDVGTLFRLSEDAQFVRDNVEPRLLAIDVEGAPARSVLWQRFILRVAEVREALAVVRDRIRRRIARGELPPAVFRATWEALGFAPNARDTGTPADDFLDGIFIDSGAPHGPAAPLGNPNIGSRARLVADFLRACEPAARDVVFDLGAGSGKLALTLAASATCHVVGVEYCADSVAASRCSAREIALGNVRFDHADARDADLSAGTIFYLYHPFRGAVARTVAERLGALARTKDIRIFSSGPILGYGEYFLREVERGALALHERRGELAQSLVLESARARR